MKNAGKRKDESYRYGLFAESLAAWFLRFKGYKILERRYKTPVGEIDLVASKGKSLIFIEVKARKKMETALGSVTPKMQQRITRAGQYYQAQNPSTVTMAVRFDLIATTPPFFIMHLDNAWRPRS